MRQLLNLCLSVLLLCSLLFIMACKESEEVNPVCYTLSGLRHWTVNDIAQSPNTSIEPNTGFNLDFIYSISMDGAFGLNITNDSIGINWGEDWELFISNQEMSKLKEHEWEQLLISRSPLDLLARPSSSIRELNILGPNGWIFIGEQAGELLKAEASYAIEKTSQCKFMVLTLNAEFLYQADTFKISISVDEPYVFR